MADNQNKYKSLFSNTIIFAIGSFSSKILVLFLVPIYTNFMSQSELGINDVIVQMANWLIPIVSLTIAEAVLRFALDKAYDKQKIFTIANVIIFSGIILLSITLSLAIKIPLIREFVKGYAPLLFLYVAVACLKLAYSTFVRALGKVKLYAVNGIIATLLMLIFNIIFIAVLKIGVAGYLLSVILSDFISILFLLFSAKLWKYFKLKSFDKKVLKAMLIYSLPLIPTQLLWLVTNSSSTFMVTKMISEEANGILTAAYKIPNLVSTIYLMFGQAWNMSAIQENDSADRSRFYTRVFDLNQSLMYTIAAGILLIVKPVTAVWIGPSFRSSINYAPILILTTVLTCFSTFMGTAYIATKNTVKSLVTSLVSGVISISLNLILIPIIGIYAAAFSALISYVVVFAIRLYDAKKLIGFKVAYTKMFINFGILVVMVLANSLRGAVSYTILGISFTAIFLLNFRCTLQMVAMFIPKKFLKKIPIIKKLI